MAEETVYDGRVRGKSNGDLQQSLCRATGANLGGRGGELKRYSRPIFRERKKK